MEGSKCGLSSWYKGRTWLGVNKGRESSARAGKRNGAVSCMQQEVQRGGRKEAHSILREQGKANAEDEHKEKVMLSRLPLFQY